MLNSPIWNKRSGFLVGGHQRLSVLDTLMGTDDYELFVDAVDLDEKTEKEQNIALNNAELQGDWDIGKLGAMFKGEGKIDNQGAGFDLGQIYGMFGQAGLEGNADGMAALAEAVRKSKELTQQIREKARQRDGFDFYLVLVFRGDEEMDRFATMLSLPPGNKFVDGMALAKKLKIPISDEPEDETTQS